jgi:hypothetical protein
VERRAGHRRIRSDVVLDNAEMNAEPEDITKLASQIFISVVHSYI